MTTPPPPDPVPSFDEFELSPAVLAAVREVGYETPSPIQAKSIPVLLEGRDLVGQAQTGTGKTAAFALPLLSRIDPAQARPQILVLTPTRELAIQVGEAFGVYARHMPNFRVLPLYGGQGMDGQLRGLKRGAQVIVGTPGRVMDHLRRGSLRLDALRAVVLDEADEMLNMGFLEDVEWILEQTPSGRQVALFSATMPESVRRIARGHLNDPVEIKIQSKTATVETISQRYWPVAGLHKLDALTRVLETEDFDGMLIFVRTKNSTVDLAEKIEVRGYAAAALNGDMNQALREKTVERFKNRGLDVLVATDVAARGLNVDRITHVLNFDIPHDVESYVHRIGRTGRAGRAGQAILFVAPRERRMLRAIERATRQPLTEMRMPSRADVADRRVALFKKRIGDALVSGESLDFFEDIVEQAGVDYDVSARRVGAALAFLLQKERPLQPAPSEREPAKREAKGAQKSRAAKSSKESKSKFAAAGQEPRSAKAKKADQSRAAKEPKRAQESTSDRKGAKTKESALAGLDMMQYRLEIGRSQGVEARHIVGAITGESGLEGQYIGPIKLYDDYGTVDLPAGMPKQILNILKKARVNGKKLGLSPLGPVGAPPKKRKKK